MYPRSLLTATLVEQTYVVDRQGGIQGLAEVPDGQQGDIESRERLHLDARPLRDFRQCVERQGMVRFVEAAVDGHPAKADGVAQGQQLGRELRGLQPGDFTAPVRSPMGFHIIKVNDFREQRQVVVKEYNARHIMVEVNELVTPRLAMEEIVEIQEKLEQGEDFAALAKTFSDDVSTANLGGDMGWFPPEAYGERVYQTLVGLDDGEISQPFQTAAGWHILQMLGTRETDRTEEAIRNEAREKIMRQKANQEVEKVLRQFRDEAFVEIRLPGHESSSG